MNSSISHFRLNFCDVAWKLSKTIRNENKCNNIGSFIEFHFIWLDSLYNLLYSWSRHFCVIFISYCVIFSVQTYITFEYLVSHIFKWTFIKIPQVLHDLLGIQLHKYLKDSVEPDEINTCFLHSLAHCSLTLSVLHFGSSFISLHLHSSLNVTVLWFGISISRWHTSIQYVFTSSVSQFEPHGLTEKY